MRLCQYYTSAEARATDLSERVPTRASLGLLLGDRVVDVTDLAARHHDIRSARYAGALAACVIGGDEWAAFRAELKAMSTGGARTGGVDAESVFFGPCVLRPAQFLDFYAFEEHVRTARKLRGLDFVVPQWYEIPAYYNSNPTSLIGHKMTALFPAEETRMDYECELACVLGKPVRNATPETAREAIAGYTILNDLSCRERQAQAMPVNLGPAPGKDFCSALGPQLVTPDELGDLDNLGMRAFVNGEQWTDGRYGTVHHRFEAMIVYASRSRRLFAGDVLGSGTVGGGCGLELQRFLAPGDRVRIEIDGLGALENRVEHDTAESEG